MMLRICAKCDRIYNVSQDYKDIDIQPQQRAQLSTRDSTPGFTSGHHCHGEDSWYAIVKILLCNPIEFLLPVLLQPCSRALKQCQTLLPCQRLFLLPDHVVCLRGFLMIRIPSLRLAKIYRTRTRSRTCEDKSVTMCGVST